MEERLTHLSGKSPLFSHNGIHDSQTHLAAPPFFYEQLRRQVALSLRTQISFSAVKITFTPRTLIIMNAAGKAEISMMIPVVFLILPISILFALWPSLTNLNLFAS